MECDKCKHFIHRCKGKFGAICGICELNFEEMKYHRQFGFTRHASQRGGNKCKRFEESNI